MPSRQPSRLTFSGLALRKLPPRKPPAGGIQHLLQPGPSPQEKKTKPGKSRIEAGRQPFRAAQGVDDAVRCTSLRSALQRPSQHAASGFAAQCALWDKKLQRTHHLTQKPIQVRFEAQKNAVPGGKKAKRLVGTSQMPYLYKPKVYMPHPSHANSSKALTESLQTRRRQRTRKR